LNFLKLGYQIFLSIDRIKHSVEAGINLRSFERWDFAEKFEEFRKMSQLNVDISNYEKCSSVTLGKSCALTITLDIFSDLFMSLGFGLIISTFILFAENFINYLRFRNSDNNKKNHKKDS